VKSPYPKEPELLPSFVAYCDILGFWQLTSSALSAGNGASFLRRLKRALQRAYRRLRQPARWHGQAPMAIKTFTDNVVLAYPVKDTVIEKGEVALAETMESFADFQLILAKEASSLEAELPTGSTTSAGTWCTETRCSRPCLKTSTAARRD
jgi:hypothetical protein